MKILKKISVVLLLVALSLATTGCYVIRAQTMRNLKGTYKLTTYTYTASYERKEGYTQKTHDYVNGEEYLYEEYLVITGTGTSKTSFGNNVHNASLSTKVLPPVIRFKQSKVLPSNVVGVWNVP